MLERGSTTEGFTGTHTLETIQELAASIDRERPRWSSLYPPVFPAPFLEKTVSLDFMYRFHPWWTRLRYWWEGRLLRMGALIPWSPLPRSMAVPLDTAYFVDGLGFVMHPARIAELRQATGLDLG